MKLTPEQIQGILERVVTHCGPSITAMHLRACFEKELTELDIPEPNPMWIHGSERLPTKNDAGFGDQVYVLWLDGDGNKRLEVFDWDAVDESEWWTPVPKHLKSPDPFEQWFKTIKPVGNLGEKELFKMAFEAGQQNPK